MAHLEGRGKIQRAQLSFHDIGNALATVTSVDAPEASRAVQHRIAIDVGIVHATRAGEQAGSSLELTVRRERHPEIFQRRRVGWLCIVHGGSAPSAQHVTLV